LHANGEADWQFNNGAWAASGSWSIVKGHHLQIIAVNPDPLAQRRGEVYETFYYHITSVDNASMHLQKQSPPTDEVWLRMNAATE